MAAAAPSMANPTPPAAAVPQLGLRALLIAIALVEALDGLPSFQGA
jgi:hypothetical protein